MMSIAGRRLAVLTAVLMASGCATYLDQAADARAGGPQQRVMQAEHRLQLAEDERYGLEVSLVDEQAYLADRQRALAAAENNLQRQRSRLAAARDSARISPEQESALGGRLSLATARFEDTMLELQSSQLAGNQSQVRAKENELAAMRREIQQINQEIDILMR